MTQPNLITGIQPLAAAPSDYLARNAELAQIEADLREDHGPGQFIAWPDDGMVFVEWRYELTPAAQD